MKPKSLIAALFATVISASVFAQAPSTPGTNTPKIDARQAKQEKRIDQGVASGQLTDKEAARLDKREANLSKVEAAAKADGVVTKKERAKLTKMENKDSKHIYRQKHDKQVKPAPAPAPTPAPVQ